MSISSSRRLGDYYQDLYAWYHVLALRGPTPPAFVGIEWAQTRHVDDVVVVPALETEPLEANQVKFHVDLRGAYSVDELLRHDGSTSLLQKLWAAWLRLKAMGRPFTLTLVSDWSWHPEDPLASLIRGAERFSERLLQGDAPRAAKEALDRWRGSLGASQDEFLAFLGTLRFWVGFDPITLFESRVRERMENRGLTYDKPALDKAVGIVARWVRENVQKITRDVLDEAIRSADLLAPGVEPAIKVCIHTIERQTYPEPPDFEIDWCDAFLGPQGPSREISDPGLWNGRFLDELRALKARLNSQPIRFIRTRGQARLTVWFAFGHTLDSRARYVLEVEQGGQRWRSDTDPSAGYKVTCEDSSPGTRGSEVGVEISITQDIGTDVVAAIAQHRIQAASVLRLKPATGVGRDAFREARDVVAFAEECRREIAAFARRHEARLVHLFYCGPLSGAAFLGHVIGAAVPEIQLYEDLRPGYAKSFLLRG